MPTYCGILCPYDFGVHILYLFSCIGFTLYIHIYSVVMSQIPWEMIVLLQFVARSVAINQTPNITDG